MSDRICYACQGCAGEIWDPWDKEGATYEEKEKSDVVVCPGCGKRYRIINRLEEEKIYTINPVDMDLLNYGGAQTITREEFENAKDEGPMKLDLDHIFLLGFCTSRFNSQVAIWVGSTKYMTIQVIVTGPDVQIMGPPIYKAPNVSHCPSPHYTEFHVHPIKRREPNKDEMNLLCRAVLTRDPSQLFKIQNILRENALAQARDLGGVLAFGWYIPEGFKREWNKEDMEVG